MESKNISIIGAGLVGSLLSIILSKKGHKVQVFERRADMRHEKATAGRSINLALSDRGIKALEEAGIMDEVKKICIPMHGRYIHKSDGSSAFQPYGKEGQYINSVSRGLLNQLLMTAAEKHHGEIFFSKKLVGIDWKKNKIELEDSFTQDRFSETADIIFGADGSYSASRLQQQLHSDRFNYEQSYINSGYKELSIPAGENGTFKLEKNALHIWPRGNFMLIALPNSDGSFTGTLFFPFEGPVSFAMLDTDKKVLDFFSKTFPDVMHIMPSLVKDFFTNPTASLVTVKCFPWVKGNKFALIGDAAHAMVPFFGQGMNCGFEDCSVLNQLMEECQDNWPLILDKYQHLRKPDGDAIADMALNNFIEMRDKVADEKFLLQKKIESKFAAKHPDKWVPSYSLVTFSPQIRYSDAMRRGNAQELIMKKIMQITEIEQIWEGDIVEEMILKCLENQ